MIITDYDPFAEEILQEPSIAYDYLLNQAPVHRYDDFDPPFYTLSRYADVEAALRDIESFSSEFGQGPRFTPPHGMLSNPPQHTFFRSLVQQAFTPRAIDSWRKRIDELANELLDERRDSSRWDAHDDFGFPLPVTVIAEMLGVPPDDMRDFKRWSDASVAAMGAKDPSQYESELGHLAQYLLEQIRRRRADNSYDDLIAQLVMVRQDGVGLTDEELLSVVNQLLVGGNETTTSLITNAVWRLLKHHSLWERLVADPSLIKVAIEESLRFDPPVLGLYRTTTKTVNIRGVEIPKDAKVMLHYAAANRDPEVFDKPNEFSLDRPLRRHLAFGLGVHFCLGAQLARLEAGTALATLVRRCPNLQLLDDGERITPFFLWGRKHLPVSG